MKTIIILTPEGQVLTAPIKNEITLKMLQELVDGYIEIVPLRSLDCVMVVNEEGKLRGLNRNHNATRFMSRPGDYIVGNAVLLKTRGEDLVPFKTRREADKLCMTWLNKLPWRCEA